jgi:hypothetical protein
MLEQSYRGFSSVRDVSTIVVLAPLSVISLSVLSKVYLKLLVNNNIRRSLLPNSTKYSAIPL